MTSFDTSQTRIPPAIIQARLSSSRLPHKALRKLGSRSLLAHVVTGCLRFTNDVWVATSDEPADDALELVCHGLGVPCFRGSEHNVYGRFSALLRSAALREPEWFFRVTGDSPLPSPSLARRLLAARSDAVDYIYVDDDEVPRGLAVELVRTESFLRLEKLQLTQDELEHVTLALYGRAELGRTRKVAPPNALAHPELRLTIDYPEDAALFRALFGTSPDLTGDEAVEILLQDPNLASLNRGRFTHAPHLAQIAPTNRVSGTTP